MKKIISAILLVAIAISACKKSSKSGGGEEEPKPVVNPSAATLTSPANNSVCLEGTVVSASISSVNFSWQAAANTNSYDVVITNLETNASMTKAVSGTQLTVNLDRKKPYSWHVVSKSNSSTQTAQSSAWKFYTAGEGTVSYAPFPASNLQPASGQSVNANQGKVTLSWTGEDADNDIKNYDVYFGTDKNNLTLLQGGAQTTLNTESGTVNSGSTYYWKVVTRDQKNNTSNSVVNSFKVL